uniref:EF-hand domain-containing protein n=1 Tax=Panagrolaimus sp. ES5 TaxID=591445 RepID=A0AC34GWS7_9BILA
MLYPTYILIFLLCSGIIFAHPPAERIEIIRPDHLEGLPLERDGNLNKDFRKEVVFGKGQDEVSKPENIEEMIREMFKKADKDSNEKITKEELKAQIIENTNKHLEDGKKEAEESFQEVDSDGDGMHAAEHNEHAFDGDTRRMIDEEKQSFSEADADDNGLDQIEWLGFQHPEFSKVMLKEMAEDIMRTLDDNRDGMLSRSEFAKEPFGEPIDKEMDIAYKKQREKEFDTEIDVDKDGFATLEELLNYVNPKNERHAVQEVTEILDIADTNKDGELSLAEMLNNSQALADSGFVKAQKKLHDDL